MILVGRYLSPFVRRVGISLKVLEIPFEQKSWSTRDDLDKILEFNPLGRVPALILDDGEVLIDSSTMLDYIDQRVGPERALIPAQGDERRRVLKALGLAQGVLEKSLSVNTERNQHTPEKRNDDWIKRCEHQINSGFAALEELALSPWWNGDSMTQADITLICAWDFAWKVLSDSPAGSQYPKLQRIIDRCNEMAEVVDTRFKPG